MTHLDNQFQKTNGLQTKRESLIELFGKQKIQFIKNKRVEWMSAPAEDPQYLDKKIYKDIDCKKLYQFQWKQLGLILNHTTQKCSLKQFIEGINQFEKYFYESIQKSMKNCEQKRKDNIFYVFRTPQIGQPEKKFKFLSQVALITGAASTIGAVGLQVTVAAAAALNLAVFGILCMPVTFLFMGVAWGYKKIRQKVISQQLKSDSINELKNNINQIEKKQLQAIAINNLKMLCLNEHLKQLQIQSEKIIFYRKDWCKNIKMRQAQIIIRDHIEQLGQFKNIKLNEQNNYWQTKIKQSKKYQIDIQIQIPTPHVILDIIKLSAKHIFDQ